jgi:hypothetical protein
LAVVDQDGAPYILVGYSLGAAAAGDFVQYDRPKHCRGVVLIADPKRHRRQVANKGVNPNNWGIAGERFIDAVQCYSLSIPDDPISALPGNNGMRMIADRVTGLRQPLPSQWWNAGYTLDWLHRYLVVGTRRTGWNVWPVTVAAPTSNTHTALWRDWCDTSRFGVGVVAASGRFAGVSTGRRVAEHQHVVDAVHCYRQDDYTVLVDAWRPVGWADWGCY